MPDIPLADLLTEVMNIPPTKPPGPMLGENRPPDPDFQPSPQERDESLPDVNKNLQDALDDVIQNKLAITSSVMHMYSFAVADLTLYSLKTGRSYAGWNDTEQMFVASLAKLLPLYAAYQLRTDVRFVAQQLGTTDLSQIATELRSRYQRLDSASIPALSLPKIETFFQVDDGDIVNFAATPDMQEDSILGAAHGNNASISALKAQEHLRLMAGWSDNFAASRVIQALGFNYLWALALRSGLYRSSWPALTRHDYRASDPGGLFVSLDYHGSVWGSDPAQGPRRTPGAPLVGYNQGATARSIVFLLSALVMEKLIDHDAHCGMLEMLRVGEDLRGFRGEPCPIGSGMNQNGWTAAQNPWNYEPPLPTPYFYTALAASKIGLGWRDQSNAFVVRAQRGAKTITAVLVGIDNSPGTVVLQKFGEEMALKLDAMYGV